jgi:hypothetical protein
MTQVAMRVELGGHRINWKVDVLEDVASREDFGVDKVGNCFCFFFSFQLSENSQMLTIVRGPGRSAWY